MKEENSKADRMPTSRIITCCIIITIKCSTTTINHMEVILSIIEFAYRSIIGTIPIISIIVALLGIK
jgi:hypothetical protein